jgi:lysozyme family protein
MKDNFSHCLKFVLKHEGGWSNHRRDPGGATMKGVTLAVYKEYLGREVSLGELSLISHDHIQDIYQTLYWDKAQCGVLPSGLDLSVFDFAVNAGVTRAAKTLQLCVEAECDGLIGSKTIAAVNAAPVKNLIVRFAEERREFYNGLKNFDTFGRGWLRRTDECETEAMKMAGDLR